MNHLYLWLATGEWKWRTMSYNARTWKAGIGSALAVGIHLAFLPIMTQAQANQQQEAPEPVWPGATEWDVLQCGKKNARDPRRDVDGVEDHQDIVGSESDPAAYWHVDEAFVYFQMRVDRDPLRVRLEEPSEEEANEFKDFSWGVAIDTDLDRRSYELLVAVDGSGDAGEERVVLQANRQVETRNDSTERAEVELGEYPTTSHARSVLVEGSAASSFGDNADYMIQWAVPRADLAVESVNAETELSFIFGTSSDARNLDADLLCQRGGRRLSESASDRERLDGRDVQDSDSDGLSDAEEEKLGTSPDEVDSDGDGTPDGEEVAMGSDPANADSIPLPGVGIRGGGGPAGCSAARGGAPLPSLCLCVALFLLRRRRRWFSGGAGTGSARQALFQRGRHCTVGRCFCCLNVTRLKPRMSRLVGDPLPAPPKLERAAPGRPCGVS